RRGRGRDDRDPFRPRRAVDVSVEHGGAPRGWLDLSASLNPLGTPRAVANAVAAASYATYADLDPAPAEAHLARDAGGPRDQVMLTAGASEALRLAIVATAAARDRVAIVGPTYGEYARLALQAGASLDHIDAGPPGFAVPVEGLLSRIADVTPRLVVLCDPN